MRDLATTKAEQEEAEGKPKKQKKVRESFWFLKQFFLLLRPREALRRMRARKKLRRSPQLKSQITQNDRATLETVGGILKGD